MIASMRRALPGLFFLLPLLVAWLGADRGQAEERPQRVPGTIRLAGDPDAVDDVRVAVAFPNLRFHKPLFVDHVPDGTNRMVVLEQDGRVLLFPNRRDVGMREVTVALDIRRKVYTRHSEEGLLGLAFHPRFRTNHELFLHYSANRPRRGVIARFRMDPGHRQVQPRSEQIVLQQRQPWGNHNGGGLAFGPDGFLYISFGDGGSGGDPLGSGQDRSTWLGSMLRIDVDGARPYGVPRDNPFLGDASVLPEIWAYGLRNVWRFSFDRLTGALWAGDVGQNAWEEIDILTAGGNYGWNTREGAHPFPGGRRPQGVGKLIDPVIEHDISQARSITGGVVYRGERLPTLRGTYLYADYATSNLWGLRYDGERILEHRLLGRGRSITSFGEDARGEVYFASFDGRIYTFVPARKRPRGTFPRKLSQTGLFTRMNPPVLHPSLLPYDVNMPLWSDGSEKTRHVMLPGRTQVRVAPSGVLSFPDGTIFVKTFHGSSLHGHRLETRLFVKREGTWAGYTYVWNAAQTDAELIDGRVTSAVPPHARQQGLPAQWTFPGRSDCMSCHTEAGGRVLGFTLSQLSDPKHNDSLDRLVELGVFDRDPRGLVPPFPYGWDATVPAQRSVRAYLDANCAMCHQPGAPANSTTDLRATIPLEQTRALNVRPGQGALGIPDARIIAPGDPRRSVLLQRMRRTDELGMPNIGHHLVDREAVRQVEQWIRQLPRHR